MIRTGCSGVLHRGDEVRPGTRRSRTSAAGCGRPDGKVAVLSDLQTGALAEVMERFAAAFGSPRVLFYEPFNYEPLRAAHDALFGLPVIPDLRPGILRVHHQLRRGFPGDVDLAGRIRAAVRARCTVSATGKWAGWSMSGRDCP